MSSLFKTISMGRARASIAFCAWSLAFSAQAQTQSADAAMIAHGNAVAIEADCAACHTSVGGAPFAGGRAIESPLGAIVASNITPSKKAGIGDYTLAQFADALRKGVARDGTHLYPAMPYPSYAGMRDEDVAALYAYMMHSVAPVDAQPASKTSLDFPFDQRWLMAGWNLLYGIAPHGSDAGLTTEEQRGRYLVDVAGHCSSCHTARGALMNEQGFAYLSGGSVGGWKAPNITADPVRGIGGWSEQQLVDYLRNGHAQGRASAAGPMAEAIEHSFSQMPESDLRAIAAYIKRVPAKPLSAASGQRADFAWTHVRTLSHENDEGGGDSTPDQIADYQHVTSGAVLYGAACASCHGDRGEGKVGLYPSLTSSATAGSSDASNLIMTVAQGIDRHDATGQTVMPAFGRDMSDEQIAAVVNYVTKRFGNPAVAVSAEQVHVTRNGGQTPWILDNIKPLIGFCVLVVLVSIALLISIVRWRWQRRRHVQAGAADRRSINANSEHIS
ncbi:c-type cytochrome [Paraburkholderia bannensis]|uniref:c-type cytochrome n=1 Tax=Paraburkholderia bannensis TaxID=765414 RepID=UPI002AB76ECA|nr:c-type cytochrome [Paraburkholderia bannensis]